MLDFIFNEWLVGFGVPIVITVGFALVGDEFKEYKAARWCFCISAAWMYGKVLMWSLSLSEFRVRAIVVFLVFGIVGVGLMEVLRLTNRREREQAKETTGTINTTAPLASKSSSPTVDAKDKIAKTSVAPIVNLMFKDASLLTPQRQKRITDDINGVASYLKSLGPLGLPVPDDIPPIGVDTTNPKGEGWSFNSQSDSKYYYNIFMLQPGMLDNRQKVTEAFWSFAVGRFIYKPPPTLPDTTNMTPQQFQAATSTPEQMDHTYRWLASVPLTVYLNHSYWNHPLAVNERPVCPDQGDGTAYYFWRIREKFGREFADRLAIFLLRATMDKPHTDANERYKQYFYERLKMADSVIDNENSKMPQIDAILTECGWLPIKPQTPGI